MKKETGLFVQSLISLKDDGIICGEEKIKDPGNQRGHVELFAVLIVFS